MKMLIFGGSGKMGAAVAWDLCRRAEVESVGLVGRGKANLRATADWLANPKVKMHVHDVADSGQTKDLLSQYDVAISTLPDRRTSYKLAQAAVTSGTHLVDMLEEYHRHPDTHETEGLELPAGVSLSEYGQWLHEQALENEVTFLSGIGFAPGLSNITSAEGIRKLDKATSAIARVGGIPSKQAAAHHPLSYMITWAFDHVLREYMIPLDVIKNGDIVEVPALSDYESFQFNQFGIEEQLECAITPGMPSFLFSRPELTEFAEKTIRWPGHYAAIETLKEVGLLDLDPVEVNGTFFVPREVLLALIEPKLQPKEGDTDVCVMYNTVSGNKDGSDANVEYYLWDEADSETGISSMGRVTGFSAAIGAYFLGRGLIEQKGIVPPEDAIGADLYQPFLDELASHKIQVLEKRSWQAD